MAERNWTAGWIVGVFAVLLVAYGGLCTLLVGGDDPAQWNFRLPISNFFAYSVLWLPVAIGIATLVALIRDGRRRREAGERLAPLSPTRRAMVWLGVLIVIVPIIGLLSAFFSPRLFSRDPATTEFVFYAGLFGLFWMHVPLAIAVVIWWAALRLGRKRIDAPAEPGDAD